MREAVIVSTARTPIGKAVRGAFNNTHGATLAGHVIQAAVARAKVAPGEVEDVILGCANPEGATGHNIARDAAIRAGLPVTVPGETINRFCSSGLMAISIAAHHGRRRQRRRRRRPRIDQPRPIQHEQASLRR
jgi:acetyl-CoA C-acetyltransferase